MRTCLCLTMLLAMGGYPPRILAQPAPGDVREAAAAGEADSNSVVERKRQLALDHFEKRIRPVLVEHCYSCHSAEAAKAGKLKANLQLDTREGIRRGGDSGPSVVPSKTDEGWLLGALRHDEFAMPPDRKLADEIISDFETWIAAGAVDPRDEAALVRPAGVDYDKARELWSLQVPGPQPVPDVRNVSWPLSATDRFVLAKLDERGIKPVGDADARTLLRRLYFDLVGLPPTPDEIRAFAAAAAVDRQGAIAEVVDRLLASPHFGERWGRHWLDVVRYADSNGRDLNVVWYDAWRYRDWVIKSLNDDKPFDDFVRQQIAGDLLPADTREQHDEQVIATAFLAMSPKMIVEVDPKIFWMEVIDEQIDVVSRAFVGLSISCARCHDHKFDPIPTHDYYALAGILQSTEPLYGFARVGSKNSPHTDLQAVGPTAEALGPAGMAHRRRLIELSTEFGKARSDRYRVVTRIGALKVQLERPDSDKEKIEAELAMKEAELKEWDEKVKQFAAEKDKLIHEPPEQPDWAMAARDRPVPSNCRLHIRGEATNLGDDVPRRVPQIFSVDATAEIPANESGRRQLAEWLASARNPLTARVAVNRVWSHLFGRGLVASVDDFGTRGTPPSHPELLNNLASQFMADGWSMKRLIRSLVLSRTYQLSSAIETAQQSADPDDVLLWRFRPRAIEVEVFRDAVLAVSGTLESSPPGRPFLSRWNPLEHEILAPYAPFVTPDQIEFNHRSVYLPVLRDSLPDIFTLFDFADPNRVVGQRDESVLPAQALFLMNSQWVLERSRRAAESLLTLQGLSDADRVDLLYERALGRLPTAAERALSVQYMQQAEDVRSDAAAGQSVGLCFDQLERWASFCQLLFASGEFRYLQ